MTDLKDKLKAAFSEVTDLVTEAGDKTSELAQKGADQAVETGKRVAEATSEAARKTVELVRTGAEEATEGAKSLVSSLTGQKQTELELLGEQRTLAELPEDQQDEYLQSLLPLLVPFDPPDLDQLRRTYQIVAFMELGKKRRRAFFEELFLSSSPPNEATPALLDDVTRFSLGKDLLGLSGQDSSESVQQKAASMLQSLKLSPDQIDVLNQWTSWENRMLEKFGHGDLVVDKKDMPLEALKKAGAIGVPLGALYVSGSIVGFSAAGISSGLATLGGASGLAALGLNPMTAGIAALVLLGVGVKTLLDAQLPTSQREKQMKLESAARTMQLRRSRYLAMLSQDLVHFHRARPGELPGDSKRRWDGAVCALEELLEDEAAVTLGDTPSAEVAADAR